MAGSIAAVIDTVYWHYDEHLLLAIGISLVIADWISSLFLYGSGIIVTAHEMQLTAPTVTPVLVAPATKPNTAYNQEELEILRTLRQDGAISDEEYQQLIEKQADT